MNEDFNQIGVKEHWDKFLESDIKMWCEWHDYWMEKVRTSEVPIYFFRFEDLLLQPEPILKDIFKMVLGEESINGTIIEHRIKDVIKNGKNFLYKPRSAGGGFHKHANKLSSDQMSSLMSKLEFYLHFFGYAKVDGKNTFDFYDYKGTAKKENIDACMDFQAINQKMLKKRVNEKKSKKFSSVPINSAKDGFSMLKTKDMTHYALLLPHTSVKK